MMSLLASRSHEWSDWKLTEFGTTQVSVSSITETYLSLEVGRQGAVLKIEALLSVLDTYEQALSSVSLETKDILKGFSLEWEPESFVSEFCTPKGLFKKWALERSSSGVPKLWVIK